MASKARPAPPPLSTHPHVAERRLRGMGAADNPSPSSAVSLPRVSRGQRPSPKSGTYARSPAAASPTAGAGAPGPAFPQLPRWGREPGASVSDARHGMLRQATPAGPPTLALREGSTSPFRRGGRPASPPLRGLRSVSPESPSARRVSPPPVPPKHPALATVAANASLMPSPLHAVALVSARPGSPETQHRARRSSPVRREATSPFEPVHRDSVSLVDSPLGGGMAQPHRRAHHTGSRPNTGGAGSEHGLIAGASAVSPAPSPSVRGSRLASSRRSTGTRTPGSLARRAMSQSRGTTPGLPEGSSALQHGAIYEEARVIPKEFVCPLTKLVMNDPVITFEGVVYERAAVLQWFRAHKVSPVSGYPIKTRALRPCNTLRKKIKAWLQAHPDISARVAEMARAQYLHFAVRVQQDLVFSLHPRADDEVKPRELNRNFGMSDEVRMILQKTSMMQYARVFKEWGFDETSSAALMEERHLQDMGVKIGHIPVIMHEISRLKWARMEIDRLEEARIIEEDKARRKEALQQADRNERHRAFARRKQRIADMKSRADEPGLLPDEAVARRAYIEDEAVKLGKQRQRAAEQEAAIEGIAYRIRDRRSMFGEVRPLTGKGGVLGVQSGNMIREEGKRAEGGNILQLHRYYDEGEKPRAKAMEVVLAEHAAQQRKVEAAARREAYERQERVREEAAAQAALQSVAPREVLAMIRVEEGDHMFNLASQAALAAEAAGLGPRDAAVAAANAVTQRHVRDKERRRRKAEKEELAKKERQRLRMAARQLEYEAKGLSPEEALRIAAAEYGMRGKSYGNLVAAANEASGSVRGGGQRGGSEANNAMARHVMPGGMRDQQLVASELVDRHVHREARASYIGSVDNRHLKHHRASFAVLDGSLDRRRAPAL